MDDYDYIDLLLGTFIGLLVGVFLIYLSPVLFIAVFVGVCLWIMWELM